MLKKEKQAVVKDLKERIEGAESVFLADFTGIDVKDVTELRKDFRKASVEYLVAKNTLIRRAVKDGPVAELEEFLEGPTSLVLSGDDGIAAAKIISKFAQDHKEKESKLKVKVGFMAGKVLDSATVGSLARLPGRDMLLAQLLGTLNSPVSGLVNVLSGTLSRFVRVLDNVRQAKESEGK